MSHVRAAGANPIAGNVVDYAWINAIRCRPTLQPFGGASSMLRILAVGTQQQGTAMAMAAADGSTNKPSSNCSIGAHEPSSSAKSQADQLQGSGGGTGTCGRL